MRGELTHAQIVNASSSGIIATDRMAKIIFVNEQAEKILGYEIKQIVGAYIPEILPMTGKLVLVCLKTGEPQLGQHILGTSLKLVVNVTKFEVDGRTEGVVCTFEGMREFELSAKKLESYRRLNDQLKAIFHLSSDGIWVSDGQGTVLNINEASEKLNDIRAKDVVGKNIRSIVKSGLIDQSATLEVLVTKRQVNIMQYTSRTKKHLLLTGTPVFDEEGNISFVVVNERDMTKLNALQERLEQSRIVSEKFKDQLAELSMLELKKQEIIGESKKMREVLRVAFKLGQMEVSNILILGESGTGKGLLAKFIHKNSKRHKKPFIQINCAALPENLLEAELFGYEKGAFTGAREKGKIGLFELAHGGTLFLDEIGEISLSVQAKLLKYLEDQEVLPLGSIRAKKVDCTIIAATNRDLESSARTRKFRQDLYYRLNIFTIQTPPLRERPHDIFDLSEHFLKKYNTSYGLNRRVSPEVLETLQSYPFPGNVRELKNVLKRAVIMSEKNLLDDFIVKSLEAGAKPWRRQHDGKKQRHTLSLKDEVSALEKEILKDALDVCKSTREMAEYLGISQPTVVRKMKRHGISKNSMQ